MERQCSSASVSNDSKTACVTIRDNEERFSLGGAAHVLCRQDSELESAPVSEKRIGLNRSPDNQFYGD